MLSSGRNTLAFRRESMWASIAPGASGISGPRHASLDLPAACWDVLSDDLDKDIAKSIPLWFALGNRVRPRASRRGKYLHEWVRANGSAPGRGDRLSPNVFTGRIARVEIGDTDSPIPYSVVKKNHPLGNRPDGSFKSVKSSTVRKGRRKRLRIQGVPGAVIEAILQEPGWGSGEAGTAF